jgi:LysM repeat protein
MYCINYVIKPGDTLYSISRHFNVSISAIMDANPMVNVYNLIVDGTICIPVSVPQSNYTNFTTYLVEENETLGSLLDKNNINLADLMEFNSLDDIHLVPGTTVKVPITGAGESGIEL